MAKKKIAKQETPRVKDVTKGGARERARQATQFEFTAPHAHEVFLVGEFNNWNTKANPMKKDSDGTWRASIPLDPGSYQYRFFSDGKWENDPSADCTPNEYGSMNCVRIVS